ncbi:MAG: hypothetical protein ACRBFS_01705 [Aureispira sp.]
MATKQELLELLESLEKSEKQAITLERNKKKTDHNYIVLYDWIEKHLKGNLGDYNRDNFLESIGNSWKLRKLQTAEQVLYDKILEILSFKYLGKNSITLLNQRLAEADILKNKGFYNGSLERLKKAEDIAYDHHKYALLMEILPKKIDVILLTRHAGRKEKVKGLSNQLKRATKILQQEAEYRSLNVNLLVQYQESRNPDNIPNPLKEDYFSIINRDFPNSGSFYSQYYFYSTQAIWNTLHKNTTLAYENQRKVVDLWQEVKDVKKENTQLYLTQLANLINYAVIDRNFMGAQAAILLMEQVKTQNKDEEAEKTQNLLFYKQYLLLNENKFEEAKKLVPSITALLAPTGQIEVGDVKELKGKAKKTYEENQRRIIHYKRVNPSRLYNFHYNTLITLLLCDKQYVEANKWLKRLVSLYKGTDLRKDIQQLARVFQLVINYGLKSDEFSNEMFKKLYNTKKVKQPLIPFEQILYDFFKEMTSTPSYTQRRDKHLKVLLNKLEALENKDQKVLGYEDIILWIKKYV